MIFKKIKDLICERFEVDEASLTLDTDLMDDLEADSLDMADLISAIEEEFEVKFKTEELSNFKTIGELVEYIERS